MNPSSTNSPFGHTHHTWHRVFLSENKRTECFTACSFRRHILWWVPLYYPTAKQVIPAEEEGAFLLTPAVS